MDGNRRWAKQKGLSILEGYKEGLKTLESFLDIVISKKIEVITLYAFSTENWQRSTEEINYIKKLLITYLTTKSDVLFKNNIRFIAIGSYEDFGKDIALKIKELEEKTSKFNNLTMYLALNYGARQEIIKAVNEIVALQKKDIDIDNFKDFLYTKNIIDPDIIIRTGGEKRLSNFLLFQASYSELFFLDKMWPDFNIDDLNIIMDKFYKIERKYGK